jgi:tripartite-type tricarboxylate transporter receptor subunit TctC
VAETAIAGYESTLAYGLVAPKGTPAPVLETLGAAMAASVDSPKLREAFRQEGAEPMTGTPAAFEAHMQSESRKYGRLIESADIKVE